jgi:hypothetical protein
MTQTNDDVRTVILGEVQALRYEMVLLDSRDQARSIKGRLDDLVRRATELRLDAELIIPLRIFRAEARVAVVHAFGGTLAWDESETGEEMKARRMPLPPAPGSEPLLVEAELAELEYRCRQQAEKDGNLEAPFISAHLGAQLVADVRRLRSDDWVLRAMDEVDLDISLALDATDRARVMAIVWKHRDGQA